MNRNTLTSKVVSCVMLATASSAVMADEGGVSFWLPGQYGSLAAVPGEPGWTLPLVYFHGQANTGGNVLTQRGNRLTAGVDARSDLLFAFPTYTFATPVLGAQAAVSAGGAVAHVKASADATLTGPGGNVLSGSESDSRTGASDLYVTGTLKWNRGVHNFLAYTSTSAPTGTYDKDRLANTGLNHWTLDGGGGYTYFDTQKGNEFSTVLGLTHNFKNDDTDYRNGTDAHIDWAASQFLSQETHIGVAGYFYQQVSGDSGSGARLGGNMARVAAIGPQAGRFFKIDGRKWYANLKAYYEFNDKNRPSGWNVWVSIVIPLGIGG